MPQTHSLSVPRPTTPASDTLDVLPSTEGPEGKGRVLCSERCAMQEAARVISGSLASDSHLLFKLKARRGSSGSRSLWGCHSPLVSQGHALCCGDVPEDVLLLIAKTCTKCGVWQKGLCSWGCIKDPEMGDGPGSPVGPRAVTGVIWEPGRCRKGPEPRK